MPALAEERSWWAWRCKAKSRESETEERRRGRAGYGGKCETEQKAGCCLLLLVVISCECVSGNLVCAGEEGRGLLARTRLPATHGGKTKVSKRKPKAQIKKNKDKTASGGGKEQRRRSERKKKGSNTVQMECE